MNGSRLQPGSVRCALGVGMVYGALSKPHKGPYTQGELPQDSRTESGGRPGVETWGWGAAAMFPRPANENREFLLFFCPYPAKTSVEGPSREGEDTNPWYAPSTPVGFCVSGRGGAGRTHRTSPDLGRRSRAPHPVCAWGLSAPFPEAQPGRAGGARRGEARPGVRGRIAARSRPHWSSGITLAGPGL